MPQMSRLDASLEHKLTEFACALVDQRAARTIVSPNQSRSGFWFGGGNLIADDEGDLLLVGRYRDAGDSRSGLGAGPRGRELAVFRSHDQGQSFQKILSFSKSELDVDSHRVLSFEGSALRRCADGFELFVSSEKENLGYPADVESFLKPGTGVWTIDRLAADSVEGLKAAPRQTMIESRDPRFIHVKDPFVYDAPNGDLLLFFCSHPFNWSSSNTAYAVRRLAEPAFDPADFRFFPRGFTWDVAITRGTCLLDIPPLGQFADRRVSLMFYDGGEALRRLEEHAAAVERPRGYSCEELGGLASVVDNRWREIERLSRHLPFFVSPWGTGCSRYVDVLATPAGFYATWQQSQADFSQPLVMNFLSLDDARRILE